MATNIVIVVSGGNVQDCYSNDPELEVEVIDFDNVAGKGKGAMAEAEVQVDRAATNGHHVY